MLHHQINLVGVYFCGRQDIHTLFWSNLNHLIIANVDDLCIRQRNNVRWVPGRQRSQINVTIIIICIDGSPSQSALMCPLSKIREILYRETEMWMSCITARRLRIYSFITCASNTPHITFSCPNKKTTKLVPRNCIRRVHIQFEMGIDRGRCKKKWKFKVCVVN